jgi:hypothetical protein
LYKDADTQAAQKYFQAMVAESDPIRGHQSWRLRVPGLPNPVLLINEIAPFEGGVKGSFVTGYAEGGAKGRVMLHGVLHSEHYQPQ